MITTLFFIFFSNLFISAVTPKQVQDFTLTNAVNGNAFSLSDYADAKAIVILFNSNYCPYSKLYDQRISSLLDTYRPKGVKFVFINPNNPRLSPADRQEELAKKIRDMRWDAPYLVDSEQKVASMFDVNKTPEAFVLQKRGSQYEILYRGAIDDNPQVASDVSHRYLQNALDAILSNKPVLVSHTHPTGCMIKR
ncbi:MAG: redoxin domain-containing protein [Cyclobacteriaceae bacterium]